MKRIIRKSVRYRCGTCKTKYGSARAATRCERSGVEPKSYRVGDAVRARAKRTCVDGHQYAVRGKVARVLGPEPYDPEVHLKGFGIVASGHLYLYEISYDCPACGEKKRVRYPAAALVPDKRR